MLVYVWEYKILNPKKKNMKQIDHLSVYFS